jgi:hypothetical protein
MLSALVQSQAAIVAIVITLTLIAVQLTASAYSPQVIDIFKKNSDMWLLLGCYGVSIYYGFIVLKLVEGAEGEAVSQSAIWALGRFSISFEFCVSMAYWLGAFTFVALFPYMLNIIGLLKSENIIKRLAVEVTRGNFLKAIGSEVVVQKKGRVTIYRHRVDPIQPIVDIIKGSIMKYDFATTRVGLGELTDQMIELIESKEGDEFFNSMVSDRFCEHLEYVSKVAIGIMDADTTLEVIMNLEKFMESEEKKNSHAARRTLDAVILTASKKDLMPYRDFDDYQKTRAHEGLKGTAG